MSTASSAPVTSSARRLSTSGRLDFHLAGVGRGVAREAARLPAGRPMVEVISATVTSNDLTSTELTDVTRAAARGVDVVRRTHEQEQP